ncbi:MAG: hypothetical protein NTY76_05725 [Candidatus Omnitrophica bacterium]|nr:hypothetical protein [Candidatus Omnitrophota bacterium]
MVTFVVPARPLMTSRYVVWILILSCYSLVGGVTPCVVVGGLYYLMLLECGAVSGSGGNIRGTGKASYDVEVCGMDRLYA